MTTRHDHLVWFNVAQAAEYSGYCTRTVGEALRSGELRGHQRVTAGRWRIRREWLDAWLAGEQPVAQAS